MRQIRRAIRVEYNMRSDQRREIIGTSTKENRDWLQSMLDECEVIPGLLGWGPYNATIITPENDVWHAELVEV